MAIVCPVCSAENPDDAPECQRCHLSAGLFDLVRAAVEVPPDDPAYLVKAQEVAAALGAELPKDDTAKPAELSHPARFLEMRTGAAVVRPPAAPAAPAPPARRTMPGLPALPAAGDVTALRRRVEEYLWVGRREGLNLTAFEERTRLVATTANREELERLDRDLFVTLAAALTADYESIVQRRDLLATIVSTVSADVELSGCRSALSVGDLAGAQRRLRHVETTLTDLEEEWATVQILVAEVELLAETMRELGGDPGPALGPLEEGKSIARAGRREEAERLLAKATGALWAVLSPMFIADLDRLKEALLKARERGVDIGVPILELHAVVLNLRHRNFASAVVAYRRVREFVEQNPADAPPEPAAVETQPASQPE